MKVIKLKGFFMIKKYSPIHPETNNQHEEIVKWLENHPNYSNTSVFIEFIIQIYPYRNTDLVIFLPNSIFVLELKRHDFTKTSSDGEWEYWDSHKSMIKPYTKNFHGKPENPYQQATDTARNLTNFIKKKRFKITKNKKMLDFFISKDFRIYPVVYINESCEITTENFRKHNWCQICVGTKDLDRILSRTWENFESKNISFTSEMIEILAEELDISDLKFTKKGVQNQTLISILDYMVKYHPQWTNEDQIKQDVFASGEKRIDQIRKALRIGRRYQMIKRGKNYFKLDKFVILLNDNGYPINTIYSHWPKILRLSDFQRNDPTIFKLYVSEQIQPKLFQLNQPIDISGIYDLVPGMLLIYSLDKLLEINNNTSPKYFREEGLLWIDIKNHYYLDFFDEQETNLISEFCTDIQFKQKILIIGKASTGKTAFIRILGYHLLLQEYPVLLLAPTDLDNELIKTFLDYDESSKNQNSRKIVIIIENIHTASAEELNFLEVLLKPLKKLIIVLTSRKSEILINKKNILTPFSKEDGFHVINLDSPTLLYKRNKSLIERILLHHLPSIESAKMIEFREILMKRTNNVWPLLRFELQLLLNSISQKTIKKLLEDQDYHESEFKNIFMQYISDRIQKYYDSKIKGLFVHKIREIEFLLHVFAFLEIPLRQDLFQGIIKLEDNQIYLLFQFWEESGITIKTDEELVSIHPLFAKKYLEIIHSSSSAWDTVERDLKYKLQDQEGNSLIDKIRQKLMKIDPSLLNTIITDDFPLSAVDFSMISDEELLAYASKLSLDDFVELINQMRYSYRYSYKKFRKLWTNLTIPVLKEKILNSNHLFSAIRFLDLIFETKWSGFEILLEEFLPDFFLFNFDSNCGQIRDILPDLEKWNYSRRIIVEIKNILRNFDKDSSLHGFSSNSSYPSFEIVDGLDAQRVLNIIQENDWINFRGFLIFLTDSQRKFKQKSILLKKLITIVMEDHLVYYPISTFYTILGTVDYYNLLEKSQIKKIINKWDYELLHSKFLNLEPGWFRSLISIFSKWNLPKISSFIQDFSLSEITKIWTNPTPENEESEYLIDFLRVLREIQWPHLSDFIDWFGLEFHLKNTQIETISGYMNNDWLIFLLDSQWNSQKEFIQQFDFLNWASHQEIHSFKYFRDNIISKNIPHEPDIMQIFLEKAMNSSYYSQDFEEILDYCEANQWNWKEWIQITQVEDIANKNLHQGKQLIEFLKDHGWDIPANLTEHVITKEILRKENHVKRLSHIEKAHHYIMENNFTLAIGILEEVRDFINSEHDFTEFQSFMAQVQKLDQDHQSHLLKDLLPNIFQVNLKQGFNSITKIIVSIRELDDLMYPHIIDMIVNVFFQVSEVYSQEFWKKLHTHKLLNKYKAEIWKKLWDLGDYTTLSELPLVFNEVIILNKEKIIPKLNEMLADMFLWDLYFKCVIKEERDTNYNWKKILQQIFSEFSTLDPLINLFNIFPHQTQKILPEFLEFNEIKIREIILQTSSIIIFKILNHYEINNSNFSSSLTNLIALLTVKQWELKLNELDVKFHEIFLIIIRKQYPDFLPSIVGIEDTLWDI